MSIDNPTRRHEERRELLEALAILGGCRELLVPFFPDGTRPDVLRFDAARRHVFLGDAKDSETPGCRETHRRLAGYAEWLGANAAVGGSATLALCHANQANGRWLALLESVAESAGFARPPGQQLQLDPETVVSWIELRLPVPAEFQAARRPLASVAPT